MSTVSLARRRIDIQSLTNPVPPEDDWRRNLSESGLRASLTSASPAPRKVVWDSAPSKPDRNVDEDYDRPAEADDEDAAHSVAVAPPNDVPDEYDDPESDGGDNESSRSRSPGSVSRSHTHTRSPSPSSSNSPRHSNQTAIPGCWAWPRIPNPHPSLLTAAQGESWTGPVRRREVTQRQSHAVAPVLIPPHRSRVAAPVPVEGLTKKSRGRRVPTASNAAVEGDVVFQAGKDGEKLTRMFACTVDGCGKCFHRGEHLKRHIRSIHTNERPHSCPEPDCLKTFSRHDNLIQHMKTHGRPLPPSLPAASTSRESLDPTPAPVPSEYRYYPGPMANMHNGNSSPEESEMQGESEIEPESEDDSEQAGANGSLSKSDGESKLDVINESGVKSEGDEMEVDVQEPGPGPVREHPSETHAPALGRPRNVQVPLVFQSGVMATTIGAGAFSPPGRARNPSETSGKSFGSPGELHCPHVPCGKTFRRGEHLRRHIKGIHLAERPHVCLHPGCEKTFSRHDNLMQHAKRHARPSTARKPASTPKRMDSTQSTGTEADEPDYESEDDC